MADLVGQGVFQGEPAPVVGRVVVPLPLHPAAAVAAEQDTAQLVGVPDAMGLVLAWATAPGPQDLLGLLEDVLIHDRRLGGLLGPDSLVLRVPAHLVDVAQG